QTHLTKLLQSRRGACLFEKGRRMSHVAWRKNEWLSSEQLQHLTPRQFQIASLAAQGLSNKEVGRLLKISEGTVKLHLHKIYMRLGLRNRTELASVAFPLPERHASISGRI